MSHNIFQKLVTYNKWNIGISRKTKEEVLPLHLEKKHRKNSRNWSKNYLTPTSTVIYKILSKNHTSI